jgi:folate-binding protein YgfZ
MLLFACPDRSVISMRGADCEELLQRLITTNLDQVEVGKAGFGALLAPQGKILMDFLVIRQSDGFLFDLDSQLVDGFIKKMTLYKMRSDVTTEKSDLQVAVSLGVGDEKVGLTVKDPRHEDLGYRHYASGEELSNAKQDSDAMLAAYIKCGVPQGGTEETPRDFLYGDAFPHDVNLDQLGGIDYNKGCYVGQEVVSRMHHRGTSRKRIVKFTADQTLTSHAVIRAGEKSIGQIGLAHGNIALAQIRLDRLATAHEQAQTVQSEQGLSLSVSIPAYADFAEQFGLSA